MVGAFGLGMLGESSLLLAGVIVSGEALDGAATAVGFYVSVLGS